MSTFKQLTLSILCIAAIGCSMFHSQPNVINLNKPVRPVLPIVESTELECLSSETSFKIEKRLLLLRHYSEELESVINSVNNKP